MLFLLMLILLVLLLVLLPLMSLLLLMLLVFLVLLLFSGVGWYIAAVVVVYVVVSQYASCSYVIVTLAF